MSSGLKTTLISVAVMLAGVTAAAAPDKESATAPPAMTTRQEKAVAEYMLREGQALKKRGYTVEKESDGTVIVVTLPAGSLFAPNDTTLMESGAKLLEPLMAYMAHPDRFKIVVATHSDHTGSPSYKVRLTQARLAAVMDYIDRHASHPEAAQGYAMADEEPLRPNTNRHYRDINRRVEIYIVPGNALLERLRKK